MSSIELSANKPTSLLVIDRLVEKQLSRHTALSFEIFRPLGKIDAEEALMRSERWRECILSGTAFAKKFPKMLKVSVGLEIIVLPFEKNSLKLAIECTSYCLDNILVWVPSESGATDDLQVSN
ncbi:hypothetical protein JTB14_037640 [Gonioctena quinquepunctata]|nr:hypothetical protein JTB14_037640 [Gonioctena quinquepunctata]